MKYVIPDAILKLEFDPVSLLPVLAREFPSLKSHQLLVILAEIALGKSEIDTALSLYTRAYESAPSTGLLKRLAKAAYKHLAYPAARPYVEKAYQGEPTDLSLARMYVNCLLDSADGEKALRAADEALKLHPGDPELIVQKASAYRGLGRYQEAITLLKEMLEKNPEQLQAMKIYADVIGEEDSAASLPLYKRALDLYKKKGEIAHILPAKWNMSNHLLRARKFDLGYVYWELGKNPMLGTLARTFPAQLLNAPCPNPGDSLGTFCEGKPLFVCPEQGIGDQVMFLSALPDLLEEYPKVILPAENRLFPILSRSFPTIEIVDLGFIHSFKHIRSLYAWLPLGSLFTRYRRSLTEFKCKKMPILKVDLARKRKVRDALMAKANGRKIVGLSWRGGRVPMHKRMKSIEPTDMIQSIPEDALLVNLQYSVTNEEIKSLKQSGREIIIFNQVDFTQDLDGWLTIMNACDAIVSVSTALVHFAGASGVKTLVVLPEKQGPWILGQYDEAHVIYPTVRIAREINTEEKLNSTVREFLST